MNAILYVDRTGIPWRSLAHDHETHPHRSAAMIRIAAIDLMSRRLTCTTTLDWRDT